MNKMIKKTLRQLDSFEILKIIFFVIFFLFGIYYAFFWGNIGFQVSQILQNQSLVEQTDERIIAQLYSFQGIAGTFSTLGWSFFIFAIILLFEIKDNIDQKRRYNELKAMISNGSSLNDTKKTLTNYSITEKIKIIRNPLHKIILYLFILVGIAIVFIAVNFIIPNSLYNGLFSNIIATIIAVYLIYLINYNISFYRYKNWLINEIIDNYNRFTEFQRYVDACFDGWHQQKVSWIEKKVTTRIELNEVFHFFSDKAYFAFINKGFQLEISESILNNLCMFYFFGKKFSEEEQNLEARVNETIIQESIDFSLHANQIKMEFLVIQTNYKPDIDKHFRNLNKSNQLKLE